MSHRPKCSPIGTNVVVLRHSLLFTSMNETSTLTIDKKYFFPKKKEHLWDPLKWGKMLWPHVTFYKEQKEIIYSVEDNNETIVVAGNMLGKDFVSAFITLYFFCSRRPCRIITTSVDGTQLEAVLWGEIRNFVQTAKYPLPIKYNHLHIRRVMNHELCGLSYIIGRVAAKGEGMLGHHVANIGDDIPRTLFVADEASGIEDVNSTTLLLGLTEY